MNDILSNFVHTIRQLPTYAKTLEVDGKTYIDIGHSNPTLVRPFYPAAVLVNTLSGLVSMLESGLEATRFKYEDLILQINSEKLVTVFGRHSDSYGKHEALLLAELFKTEPFPFDRYLGQEAFNIKLASMFVQDTETEALLRITGNLAARSEIKGQDDGLSQQVTVTQGISGHMVETVVPRNRYTLAPFRTFREAVQPASDFLLRLNNTDGSNQCALFEADGGAWKIAAMQNIKTWLENRIASSEVEFVKSIPVIY